jgi:hypothetical protein
MGLVFCGGAAVFFRAFYLLLGQRPEKAKQPDRTQLGCLLCGRCAEHVCGASDPRSRWGAALPAVQKRRPLAPDAAG